MEGHKISNGSIELSYKHAHEVEEQGERLERVGMSLTGDQRFTQQESEFVQKAAQQIQAHAKAMYEYIRVAERDAERSTTAFTSATQEHAEAIKLHVEINKILLKPGSTSQVVPDSV